MTTKTRLVVATGEPETELCDRLRSLGYEADPTDDPMEDEHPAVAVLARNPEAVYKLIDSLGGVVLHDPNWEGL